MSTPFEFFRRHQKVALAAVTGAAVLSFVVFDASGSGQLSPFGLATLVIGCMAIVGWIWGAREGKSAENAIFGGVLGLAISLVFSFMGRPPAAITATSGDISRSELEDLGRKRTIANRMINLVYYGSNPNAGFMAQFQLPRYMFNFGSQDQTDDVLISELLSREADDLGIQVTDAAVMNFLKEVAGKDAEGDDQLTKKVFNESIKNINQTFTGTTEDSVIDAIRHELRARQAAQILLGGNRMTPADVWDIHRKLNTRQSAEFVALPVQDFVDKNVEPTEAELTAFFNEYKGNFPNTTATGTLEEGRPGLFLPRRMRLAYLEPNYEELEKQAGEITEEEIQQRYEERYQREVPAVDPHGELSLPDLPLLPSVPKTPETPAAEAPSETPATEAAADPASPVSEKPAEPAAETPAAPAAEAPPASPPAEEKPAEDPAKPEGTSARVRLSRLQPVVLVEDQPAAAAEQPADPVAETPAAEAPAAPEEAPPAAPAADAPAAPAAEEKPAETPPAAEPAAPATENPAEAAPLSVPPVADEGMDEDPAPPVSGVRPLTEELRQQIRDELLAEKTRPLVEAKIEAARELMSDLHLGVAEYLDHQRQTKEQKKELSSDAITPEEATKRVKEYAEKNGLVYTETPLLSLEELMSSDDYPVGGAAAGPQGRSGRVVDVLNQSQVTELYTAMIASNFQVKGSYAFWKIEDIASHEPKSLEEPGVKELAVKAWRAQKARALAEKRAKDLADVIAKADKPLIEALAEQTVTGEKDKSVFVTVKSTGEFSWLQRSLTPQRFGGDNSPRLGAIQGVEGAGESFMSKVFDNLKPGETAVVPNFDRSIYYVMKIEKRSPATEAEVEVMRKQFIESQGDLSQYAMNQSRSRDGNFADRLFVKHGIKLSTAAADDVN